ncbi:uncharacterized protein LOC129313090 isoform X2 [Prosopis cineraria]|uniref:uncharacterized protein LOC129313090 isoform X2 n=1 Tax=Prosopis cineraria TaxID=364024 RepID=UPI00240FF0F3|nr:uncharacterized protein LOC129313090 isoform X2 [Prosopis cineraria]
MSLFLFSPTLNAINQKRWVALGWPKGFVGRWSRRSEDRSYPMNNFPKCSTKCFPPTKSSHTIIGRNQQCREWMLRPSKFQLIPRFQAYLRVLAFKSLMPCLVFQKSFYLLKLKIYMTLTEGGEPGWTSNKLSP